MRKKFLFLLLLLFSLILAISSVSAAENATDAVKNTDEVITDELMEVNEVSDIEDQVLSEKDSNQVNQVIDNDVLSANSTSDVAKSKSSVSASKTTGYSSFNTKFVVKLAIDGKAVKGKEISIKVNKKKYTALTNKNGQASFNLNLPKGTYKVNFAYSGDGNTTSSSGSSKIIIKESKKTRFLINKYLNHRQGLKTIFDVRLVDQKGNAIKHKLVKFKVAGKTYKVKTSKKGYAKLHINLKKGTYKIKCSFSKKAPYLACKKTTKIKVRSKMVKGNGYWMWPVHMASTNLKTLADKGTKHIFLLGEAVSAYGKSYVTSWIKKAHSYGIKVHLWIMVCCDGDDWVSPVRDDGSLKHGFIKQKINEAKYYASIKGVNGIHLDYMRYGGTAHNHINAIESINYIVKKISYAVHSVKPNAMVSIAIMPEPDMMHYYYGQDVPTLSRYADALLPMVYKGSYGQPSKWIKSVTKTFVKQSNGAQIWTGLQTYKSEEDTSRISYDELMKDARYAMKGGAKGVVLFRIGITHYLNFKKV